MLLGLIADTHDNLPKIKKAVRIFNRKRVSFVLHTGDYIAPFSTWPFKELKCEYLGVFGNNDGEREGLIKESGGRIKEGPIIIEKDSKKIVLVHDLNKLDLNPVRNFESKNSKQGISNGVKDKTFDLVVFGHTHKPEIRREFSLLIINPGECSGWLTKRSTIATLDLENLSIKFFRL